MINSQFPTARTSGLVVQDVPNEVLVYDLESNKAHCLNQTAAMVWRACDGKTSVPEIARLVGSQSGEKVSDDSNRNSLANPAAMPSRRSGWLRWSRFRSLQRWPPLNP
jgi:hypothetical protein